MFNLAHQPHFWQALVSGSAFDLKRYWHNIPFTI